MGARSPINQRPRRGGLKCEFCTRSYPSVESLRTHQNSLHSLALKEKEKKRSVLRKVGRPPKATKLKLVAKQEPKDAKTPAKVVTKKLPVKPVPKESPTKQLASLVGSKVMDVSTEAKKEERVNKDLKPSTKMRKVEFQCPICIRTFPVYFSAIKHIQNKHQNYESSSSIEPVRKEFCIFCNTMVSNNKEDHECEMRDLTGLGWTYVCAACEQKFTSTMHFDIHVREVHHEGVESMFFPNMDEFNEWKSTMEKQTNTSYVMIGRYHSKKIYRCSKYRNEDDTPTAYFCPSTLIFQEFSKGIQVHFYKEHFGHPCSKYVLSDTYKAYSITDMLHEATGYSEITNVRSAEDDLYCQFKKLMESIVVDAAKVNVEKLKVLTGKALQMISILKTYKSQEDEDEAPLSLYSNSSSNLTKALEILNSSKSGRRSVNTTIEVVPAKRIRNQNGSHEKSPILQKTLSKPKVTSNTFSLADNRDDQKILQELGGANANVSSPTPMPIKKTVESPSFNDTYKHFVEKNLKSTPLPVKATAPKKKTIVKTKMGQFKPNVSPKKPVKTDRTSRTSLGKASDIVYEVKEQENDCNILILKI